MSSVSTEPITTLSQKTRFPFFTQFSTNLLLRSFVFISIFYFSAVLGGWPGQAVIPVLVLGGLLGLGASYLYGYIAGQNEAAGGIYPYLKHKFGKAVAFIISFVVFVFSNVLVGYLIVVLPKYIIPDLAYIAGVGFDRVFLFNVSDLFLRPQVLAVASMIVVLVGFLVSTLSRSVFPRSFNIIFIMLLLVGVIILVQIGLPAIDAFGDYWNAYYEDIRFEDVVLQAKANGAFSYNFGGMYAFASLGIVAWFFMFGLENINLNKFGAGRRNRFVNTFSVIISFIFILGFYVLLAQRVGVDWLRSQAYLSVFAESGFVSGWFTTYAGLLSPIPLNFILIVLGMFLVSIVIVGVTLTVSSAFIQSWAEDGLIPSFFLFKNRINEKITPTYLLSAIPVFLGILISVFSQGISNMIGYVLVIQIAQIPIFLSVLLKTRAAGGEAEAAATPVLMKLLAGLLSVVIAFSIIMLFITPMPNQYGLWAGLITGVVTLVFTFVYYQLIYKRILS